MDSPRARVAAAPSVETGARLRYDSSNFPALVVDPKSPTHLVLGGSGQSEGLYEYDDGTLTRWTHCAGDGNACYEGERPDSYQNDSNTIAFDLRVLDWSSDETRAVVDGVPAEAQRGNTSRPLVVLTTSRGALRCAWDPSRERYSFKHLNNDIVNMSATPPRWRTTGLGDTCVVSAVFEASGDVLLAVADGGLARTRDGGETWQRTSGQGVNQAGSGAAATTTWTFRGDEYHATGTSEAWPGGLASLGTAVIRAPDGSLFAAHTDRGSTGLATVFRSADDGDTWTVAGGYDAVTGDSVNGLSTNASLASFAIAANGSSFRLLASGDQLYVFDPAGPTGAQWSALDGACGATVANQGPTPLPGLASAFLVACVDGLFVLDASGHDVAKIPVAASAGESVGLSAGESVVLSAGESLAGESAGKSARESAAGESAGESVGLFAGESAAGESPGESAAGASAVESTGESSALAGAYSIAAYPGCGAFEETDVQLCVAVGSRDASTGNPVVLTGTLALALSGGAVVSASANVSLAMDAVDLLGADAAAAVALRKMQIDALVAVPAGRAADPDADGRALDADAWTVWAGLLGAAYFDAYSPSAVFSSENGGQSFAPVNGDGLPPLNVHAFVANAKDGSACACLDGGGVVCFGGNASTAAPRAGAG